MTDTKPRGAGSAPGRRRSQAALNQRVHEALIYVQAHWFFGSTDKARIEQVNRRKRNLDRNARRFYHLMALRLLRYTLAEEALTALWQANKAKCRELMDDPTFDLGALRGQAADAAAEARAAYAAGVAEPNPETFGIESPLRQALARRFKRDRGTPPFLKLKELMEAIQDVETTEAQRLKPFLQVAAAVDDTPSEEPADVEEPDRPDKRSYNPYTVKVEAVADYLRTHDDPERDFMF